MNDFTYQNPTRIHFGKTALSHLPGELARFGKQVVLVYGTGSVKRSGLYDRVVRELEAAGKVVTEVAGVPSNPTYSKVLEGCEAVRRAKADLILAVGGGSVVDCSKMISASAYLTDDPWEHYLEKGLPLCEKTVPIGVILTMAGTGSEMNAGGVITNEEKHLKLGCNFLYPTFSLLDPTLTLTVPRGQMLSGAFDVICHLHEQYFSDEGDQITDDLIEGLLRGMIRETRKAALDPTDYDIRANLMWGATMGLNESLGLGKTQDWAVHAIEHQVGAYTHCPHGQGLAAISPAYYRFLLPWAQKKLARWAQNVWQIDPTGRDEETMARLGIDAMESFLHEVGLPTTLRELGATEEMLPKIAESTLLRGGYHLLTADEILEILKNCY